MGLVLALRSGKSERARFVVLRQSTPEAVVLNTRGLQFFEVVEGLFVLLCEFGTLEPFVPERKPGVKVMILKKFWQKIVTFDSRRKKSSTSD
jgi:hypothetical protein